MNLIKPLTLAIALMLGTTYAYDADAARRDDKAEETFPDATREDPKAEITDRIFKDVEKLQEAYDEAGREEEAITIAERILANDRAKGYDKGFAQLLAGLAARNLEDSARAEKYLAAAVEGNSLPNEQHYAAMQALGAVYFDTENWPKAQGIFQRIIDETKTKDPEFHKLLGAAYYYEDKFDQAIGPLKAAVELDTDGESDATSMLMGAYNESGRGGEALALAEAMLAKNPDDKTTLVNVAKLYYAADQAEKAAALLESARQRGLIATADDYKLLFAILWEMDRTADAAKAMEEGFAKKILPEDGESYFNLAQAHYFSDNIPGAIAAAQKGAPLAKDGSVYKFLAQVLQQEDRNAEAIAAGKQALAKGVDKPGEVWMVVAAAEYYSDNTAGARAAFQEAAKDPSTRSQAQEELAKLNQ
jgi:tetratricopeptide (TPR) repeat protein